ncbi:MAG TPA: hypothetical protein VG389_23365 [Myxococcota bacterium]|jgi:hypothetical protein|nr:hypothetical protein [Myxococcota bacterium]
MIILGVSAGGLMLLAMQGSEWVDGWGARLGRLWGRRGAAPAAPELYTTAVERTPAPPGATARFAAPLPDAVEAFAGDMAAYPPASWVSERLCAGDAEMRVRYLTALRAAAAKGAAPAALADQYGGYVTGCGSAPLCAWAEGVVTDAAEPAGVRAPLWRGLLRCWDGRFAPLMERADAPLEDALLWYEMMRAAGGARFSARLEAEARAALAVGDAARAWRALSPMQGLDDVRVTELLLAAWDASRDPNLRRALAGAMRGLRDPRGAAHWKEYCAGAEGAGNPVCEEEEEPWMLAGDPLADLDRAVAGMGVDVARLLADHPEKRGALRDALERCARANHDLPFVNARCLHLLASVDRPAAVEAARSLLGPTVHDSYVAEVRDGLLRFPDLALLEARLRAVGLTPAPAGGVTLGATAFDLELRSDLTPVTVRDVLERWGRAHTFDTETDTFPNAHDALLMRLAALAAPALDGVLFEEIPPPEPTGATPAGADAPGGAGRPPYVLVAWMDGQRFSARARDLDDWYDVEAVVGLLNALCAARGSDVRFAVLPIDQVISVVAGSEAALRAAAADGLFRPTEGAEDAAEASYSAGPFLR